MDCQGSIGERVPHPESMHKSSGAGSGQIPLMFNIEIIESNPIVPTFESKISLACVWKAHCGLFMPYLFRDLSSPSAASFDSTPAIASYPSNQRHWSTESRYGGFTAHTSVDMRMTISPKGSATFHRPMFRTPYLASFLVLLQHSPGQRTRKLRPPSQP